jgi:type II secretory pathway component PulJ
VVVASPRESLGESIMGWIAACVLVALLLPLGAMLYLDILEAKHEVKQQMEKVEKLRRHIEQQQRKDNQSE